MFGFIWTKKPFNTLKNDKLITSCIWQQNQISNALALPQDLGFCNSMSVFLCMIEYTKLQDIL